MSSGSIGHSGVGGVKRGAAGEELVTGDRLDTGEVVELRHDRRFAHGHGR